MVRGRSPWAFKTLAADTLTDAEKGGSMRLATTLLALLLAAYTTTPRQTWREPSCFQKRKLLAVGSLFTLSGDPC